MRKFLLALSLLFIFGLMYSQEINIENEVSMLALGDSYTIGESVEIHERWPHQMIDELRKLGVQADYPDYIATTGWTTRRLIQRIRSMLEEDKPYNLVSILIGVNNQYQGIDIASYEPDLRNIIDLALEIVDQDISRVFILSIPDYAFTPFGLGNELISKEIDDYNAIKNRIAAEYKISFIDITPISRLGLINSSLVAGDGLHPSGQQYGLWVEGIIPRINLNIRLADNASPFISSDNLKVYPNPAQSKLHVSSILSVDGIRIYNSMGSLVSVFAPSEMPVSIDLSCFAAGVYSIWAHFAEEAHKPIQRTFIVQAP